MSSWGNRIGSLYLGLVNGWDRLDRVWAGSARGVTNWVGLCRVLSSRVEYLQVESLVWVGLLWVGPFDFGRCGAGLLDLVRGKSERVEAGRVGPCCVVSGSNVWMKRRGERSHAMPVGPPQD